MLDLAVIGAGAAGTYVANEALLRRPEWSVELFERTNRIGGRLYSVSVPGTRHPIELGGMRYLQGHRHVDRVVTEHGLATHAFDIGRGPDRTVLRGVTADGLGDPRAGSGYGLATDEAGRSAGELITLAFERIVPGASGMDLDAWLQSRSSLRHMGRTLTDWAIGPALASVLSAEGHRFVNDAFGYDRPPRPECRRCDPVPARCRQSQRRGNDSRHRDASYPAGARGGIHPKGWGSQPRVRARRYRCRGGGPSAPLHERTRSVVVRRIVLAIPAPALRLLAGRVRPLDEGRVHAMLDSVEAWDAAKLYLWFDRPWWRDDGFLGMRVTTDLPPRKLFAFDEEGEDGRSVILAAYTDGRDVELWAALAESGTRGAAGTTAMVDAATRHLGTLFPSSSGVPEPVGSAFMHWGADPHECGWHYWRAETDFQTCDRRHRAADSRHRDLRLRRGLLELAGLGRRRPRDRGRGGRTADG